MNGVKHNGGIIILKDDLENVLNNFFRYRNEGFSDNNYILRFVQSDLPKNIGAVVGDKYNVKGSVGNGRWADCPNVAILDKEVTDSMYDGLYLAYLFEKNMTGVYLSFSWGSEQFKSNKNNLGAAVEDIRDFLMDSNKLEDYDFDEVMDLGSDNKYPKSYEAGSVIFKFYPRESVPDDETLRRDLNEYLDLYEFVKENYTGEYGDLLKLKSLPQENSKTDGGSDAEGQSLKYWLYAPGEDAIFWNDFYDAEIMAIGWNDVGNLNEYSEKDEIKIKLQEIYDDNDSHRNDVHALWQFANEINIGDVVFAKKGMGEIIGVGFVESDYGFDENLVFKHMRKVYWAKRGNWSYDGKFAMKTLTDITHDQETINKIKNLIDDFKPKPRHPPYTSEKFLEEVYIEKQDYDTIRNLLERRKNLIVQGPPGVGKTFMAKRLAYSLMGVEDNERVMMVQFHQSYSYEDFVKGYRPNEESFELKEGSFYKFCKKAENDSENDYFFIIDEINRGNLSKIFGELFMLIEADKRGKEYQIPLVYNDELFHIPENLYIIGLMNTADRSLAMIDYALRRRFSFFDLKPGFQTDGFQKYMGELHNDNFNGLIDSIEKLNDAISEDVSLGEGFMIGHSFFCNLNSNDSDDTLKAIVRYEIIPLLKEYWFDDQDNVDAWSNELLSVF